MNRRQFTKSLAALFATPAMPPVSLAAAAPVASLPSEAYFWADYLTRLHKRCTPDMLAPFFKSNQLLAQDLHRQLVAENYLLPSGYAHPNLVARQPVKTFGQTTAEPAQSTPKRPMQQESSLNMRHVPEIRPAQAEDQKALSDIWYEGWHEAHAAHVPEALTALRTKDNFYERMGEMLCETLVSGPLGAPLGFCTTRKNEIYQMYVGPNARGTGTAAALITAGCEVIAKSGYSQAVLDVIAENDRARAFYEKMGWENQGLQAAMVDTSVGPFELPCILMSKDLG